MLGQGSPITSRRDTAGVRTGFRWLGLCTLALAWGFASAANCPATEPLLRLRVEWGGTAQRLWRGSIAIGRGTLSDPTPLGIEADEPGSMWLADGVLRIEQRSARTYDGVDLSVQATPDEELAVQLGPDAGPATTVRIPLSELVNDFRNESLDKQGSRLVVRRAPGDRLQVTFKESSLVFLPGDSLKLEIRPHLLSLPAGSRARIDVQLLEARGSTARWQSELMIKVGDPVSLPVTVPLPNQEGAYELQITAAQANWQHAVWSQLGPKPVAERRVGLVVLSPTAPPPGGAAELARTGDEIDPANPRRWEERLVKLPQWTKLAKSRKPNFGNNNLQVRQHALGPVAQLNPSRVANDPSWEAYTLAIQRPGAPHVLEIEYPNDVPQTLGISILEPNAAGAVTGGVDSGVEVTVPAAGRKSAPRWLRHRLVFWPRTRTPLLLVTNRSEQTPAVYGKIRVLAGWETLPRAVPRPSPAPARLLAAYLDRPLFPENFSASEALDAWLGRSLDDWQTFYEGGTRLVEYLHYVGYEGLMLTVLADGSTIYPSRLVEPTPRYDTGVFFDAGCDPLRKDVLEMLLRLFDRERLQMVAAVEFAAPLPALQRQLRQGGDASPGLELVGPAGATWCQTHAASRGLAPYYNPLDPRVQEAMLDVLRELLTDHAQHPSLAGVAVKLSGHGYSLLPGPDWGLDDATIARFQHDTRHSVPGEGPQRFAQRAAYLGAEPNRRAWLEWRCEQLAGFYRRVQAELRAVKPGCQLYLAGAELFSAPDVQAELRPALPRKYVLAEALQLVGLDPRLYQDEAGPSLLGGEPVEPAAELASRAVSLELQSLPDAERGLLGGAGALFFHPPDKTSIVSFDEKSPFRPTYTELLTQVVPAEQENRRRFVHQLALGDPKTIFDGGWLLPLGQEDSLRDLVLAFHRLPAARFERLTDRVPNESSQPITVRTCTAADRTWAYVVNDAPFPASATLRLEASAGCRIEELSGLRKIPELNRDAEGTYWPLELDAYDMVAVSFSEPGVHFARPDVALPAGVTTRLATRVRGLGARVGTLGSPAPLEVLRNPGFENGESPEGLPAGWTSPRAPGVTVRIDSQDRHTGHCSVHFQTDAAPARLLSEPFESPATGRLALSVWMRLGDERRQPPLQLALEGRLNGAEYYRFAPLGQTPVGSEPVPTISAQWAQYILRIDNLPLEGLAQMRVRLDLTGPGEVWLDDVQLFNLYFDKTERMELSKLVALADVSLQNGQLSDCLRLLGGYWPRFLELHVPLPVVPVAEVAQQPNPPEPREAAEPSESPADRSGLLDRFKNALPRALRF